MEPEFKCDICNRTFGSSEALDMHNRAKHSANSNTNQKTAKTSGGTSFRKIRNWGIFVVVLGLLVWGIYVLVANGNSFSELPASEINIRNHNNLALHIHSHLRISIDDNEIEIPANTGIAPGIMRPLHTHDSTGEIHIEGPTPRDFTLGEFFEIWGETFNSECIFEYCTAPGVGAMEMFVNGQKSEAYENLTLRDHQEIVIEYHSF